MIYGGDEKTITLHIKLIHPPIRSISVKAGSTVKELVAIAAEKFGWDAKFLKLHHMSKLMKLEERLSFYGVEDGDEIIAVNAKVGFMYDMIASANLASDNMVQRVERGMQTIDSLVAEGFKRADVNEAVTNTKSGYIDNVRAYLVSHGKRAGRDSGEKSEAGPRTSPKAQAEEEQKSSLKLKPTQLEGRPLMSSAAMKTFFKGKDGPHSDFENKTVGPSQDSLSADVSERAKTVSGVDSFNPAKAESDIKKIVMKFINCPEEVVREAYINAGCKSSDAIRSLIKEYKQS